MFRMRLRKVIGGAWAEYVLCGGGGVGFGGMAPVPHLFASRKYKRYGYGYGEIAKPVHGRSLAPATATARVTRPFLRSGAQTRAAERVTPRGLLKKLPTIDQYGRLIQRGQGYLVCPPSYARTLLLKVHCRAYVFRSYGKRKEPKSGIFIDRGMRAISEEIVKRQVIGC